MDTAMRLTDEREIGVSFQWESLEGFVLGSGVHVIAGSFSVSHEIPRPLPEVIHYPLRAKIAFPIISSIMEIGLVALSNHRRLTIPLLEAFCSLGP